MVFRIFTRVREVVRVLRGLPPDDALRLRTEAINEQIVKLRETRLAQEKFREKVALQEVQFVVKQMSELKESLIAAEQAAVEFVEQIGDEAKAELEGEWNKKAESLMNSVARSQENNDFEPPAGPWDAVVDSKMHTK